MAADINEQLNENVSNILQFLRDPISAQLDEYHNVVINKLDAMISAMSGSPKSTQTTIDSETKAAKDENNRLKNRINALSGSGAGLKEMADALPKLAKGMMMFAAVPDNVKDRVGQFISKLSGALTMNGTIKDVAGVGAMWSGLGSALKNISESLKKLSTGLIAFNAIPEKSINNFVGFIRKLNYALLLKDDKGKDTGIPLKSIKAMGDYYKGVADLFKAISDGINKLGLGIRLFPKNSDKFTNFLKEIVAIGKNPLTSASFKVITDGIKGLGAAIFGLVFFLTISAPFISIALSVLPEITALIGGISAAFLLFNMEAAINMVLFTFAVRQLSMAVLILTASLVIISLQGAKAFIGLSVLFGVIGSIWVLSKIVSSNKAQFAGLFGTLIGISAAILAFTFSINKISKIGIENLLKSIVTLGVILVMLVGIMKWIGNGKNMTSIISGSASIAILSGSLLLIAFTLSSMPEMTFGIFASALTACLCIAVIARLAISISNHAGKAAIGAAVMLGLSASFLIVSFALAQLPEMSWSLFFSAGLACSILTLFAVAAIVISTINASTGGLLLAGVAIVAILAASFLVISYGLKVMAETFGVISKTEMDLGKIAIFALVMTEMCIAFAVSGTFATLAAVGAPSLFIVASVYNEFANVFKTISETTIDKEKLKSFSESIIGISTVFSNIKPIDTWLGAKAMSKVGESLKSVIESLKSISDIPNSVLETDKDGNSVVSKLISSVSKPFMEIGDDGWLWFNSYKRGARMVKKMGEALSSIASAVSKFANLDFGYDSEGNKIILTEDSFANISKNMTKVLTCIAEGFKTVGETEGNNWFSEGPVSKGIELSRDMGRILSDIAQGVIDFSNLEFTGKDGKLLKVTPTVMDTVATNMKIVIKSLGAAFGEIGKEGIRFWGANAQNGIKYSKDMGKTLIDIGKGVAEWSTLKFGEFDLGEGGVETAAKNIETMLKSIGAGFESFDDGDIEDGSEVMKTVIDALKELPDPIGRFCSLDIDKFSSQMVSVSSAIKTFDTDWDDNSMSNFGKLSDFINKISESGDGLVKTSDSIKTLSTSLKDMNAELKNLDFSKFDKLAETMEKISDAQGGLSSIGSAIANRISGNSSSSGSSSSSSSSETYDYKESFEKITEAVAKMASTLNQVVTSLGTLSSAVQNIGNPAAMDNHGNKLFNN